VRGGGRALADGAVIVSPRSTAALSASAEIVPMRQDEHIQEIAEYSQMGWQKSSRQNVRAHVEAVIGRFKRVALRSRTDETEATESPSPPGL
jgi:hypothetical protein